MQQIKFLQAKMKQIQLNLKGLNLNLGGGGSNFPPPLPCWVFLNNSEIVKAVTLVFGSNQRHFIRDICAKSGIPNSPQSTDIG